MPENCGGALLLHIPRCVRGSLGLLTGSATDLQTAAAGPSDSRSTIIAFAAAVAEQEPAAASFPLRHVTPPGEYICVLFVLPEKRRLGQSRLDGGVSLLIFSLSLS